MWEENECKRRMEWMAAVEACLSRLASVWRSGLRICVLPKYLVIIYMIGIMQTDRKIISKRIFLISCVIIIYWIYLPCRFICLCSKFLSFLPSNLPPNFDSRFGDKIANESGLQWTRKWSHFGTKFDVKRLYFSDKSGRNFAPKSNGFGTNLLSMFGD